MDSISSMNEALSYVEDHLTEDMDYGEVAKIAHSPRHFKMCGAEFTQNGFRPQVMRQ